MKKTLLKISLTGEPYGGIITIICLECFITLLIANIFFQYKLTQP
jgi:hypothetical protein